jgi:HAD superfamily hydrolase (TIGR01509 family)
VLEAIVFDFDGLIVDTEWPEYQSIAEVFVRHGAEYPPQRWLHVIGTSWDVDWLAELEADLGRPVDREALTAERTAAKRAMRAGMSPLPGVEELIAQARAAGVPLAVASSSSRSWVEGQLEALGLLDRFVLTRCLDDVAHAKPAPELYLAACAGLGVDPARAVALEDSANGTTAAKAAGMACVAVPNRLTRLLDLSHADAVVDSLAGVGLDDLRALLAVGRLPGPATAAGVQHSR